MLVDTVELSIMPLLLGSGVRLLPDGGRARLHLDVSEAFPSGMVRMVYTISSTA